MPRGITDTEFYQIRRLRMADGVPLAILTNYLPTRFALNADDLATKGLYACLRGPRHQPQDRPSADLGPVGHRGGGRAARGDRSPAACLTVDRLAYDDVGQFVEFGRHVYHAEHYSIQSSVIA